MPLVWTAAQNGQVPDRAVAGGRDTSGDTYYVGRVEFEGKIIPGKIHSAQGCIYFPYDGKEQKQTRYEALVNTDGTNIAWLPSSGGNVPQGAVQAGMQNGEPLYIGRHVVDQATVIGKIQPSQKALYVAYNGKEIKLNDYEVLVEPLQWLPESQGRVPPNAVSAGAADPKTHEVYFVGRAKYNNQLVPGKIQPSQKCLYIPMDGKEVKCTDYEVLCNLYATQNNQFSNTNTSTNTSSANSFGNTNTNTNTNSFSNTNTNSFSNSSGAAAPAAAGTNSFSNTNTTNKNNSFGNSAAAAAPSGNNNVTLEWLQAANGQVPPDTVSAGMQNNSEEVFIGRAMVEGSPVIGKIHAQNKCVYVPYNGKEMKFEQYEALVCRSRRFDMSFSNR